jgi:hypothetical protein
VYPNDKDLTMFYLENAIYSVQRMYIRKLKDKIEIFKGKESVDLVFVFKD